jgi:hypothetical protein
MFSYSRENTLQVAQYLMVPEPENDVSLSVKPSISPYVGYAPFVLASINFDD